MNVEEILEVLKPHKDIKEYPLSLTLREQKILLDYITNLQEENKRLKELDANYPIEEQLEEALKYENIYKSRNDKTIERLKKIQENAIKYGADHDAIICQDLINILQGSDEDE